MAEYPEMGMRGGRAIPLHGVPAEERLIESGQPIVVSDVANEMSLGPVRELLVEWDIRSILVVPVKSKDKLLGSFSLDSIGKPRVFKDKEIELCKVFAAQVAVAIENAQLYEETKQRADQLETLRRTTLANTSQPNRDVLLRTIIEQAVELLKAKSGGLYKYYPEREELTIIADYNRPDYVGKTLKVGEGMAGQLVQSDEPFMIVDDYNQRPGRASLYADRRHFGAVLEVSLKWQERIIGVLYIDDEVARKFTRENARLLGLFANQAAIALINAELMAKDAEKLGNLVRLSQATKDIASSLGTMTLDERLTLITQHAAEILEAEVSGILLLKRSGVLSLEASYGHVQGGFQKGQEFIIRSGLKTGLTGHIAHEGKIFNASGDALINHFAVRGVEPNYLPSGKCHSLLAIPLMKKVGYEEQLVGLLRAENKKGKDGRTLPTLSFTEEDKWILNIFADAVVIALENTGLVQKLGEQNDHWERLVGSSPNGIIAIDAQGKVTGFNKRAEEILGYVAGEVMGTAVDRLYYDPIEPRKIGTLLHSTPDGRVGNYETSIKIDIEQRYRGEI